MPTFDTPKPISVDLHLEAGTVRIHAEDRTDTVVEVRPGNGARDNDVRAAENTQVDYADGKLTIRTPKQRSPFSRANSIDVTVTVPSDSSVHGNAALAHFHGDGRLGAVRLKVAMGDIRLERTGELHVTTGSGEISVDSAAGRTEITTASGNVDVRDIAGDAVIRNSNGETRVGEILGDLRVRAANGHIEVARAGESVQARTANGDVRVREVVRGRVALETAHGEIEIGVREGSSAWIDANTSFGNVRSSLAASDTAPGKASDTVEVRARTQFGDIVIRRS